MIEPGSLKSVAPQVFRENLAQRWFACRSSVNSKKEPWSGWVCVYKVSVGPCIPGISAFWAAGDGADVEGKLSDAPPSTATAETRRFFRSPPPPPDWSLRDSERRLRTSVMVPSMLFEAVLVGTVEESIEDASECGVDVVARDTLSTVD